MTWLGRGPKFQPAFHGLWFQGQFSFQSFCLLFRSASSMPPPWPVPETGVYSQYPWHAVYILITHRLELSPEGHVSRYMNTPCHPGPLLQSSRQKAGALTSLPCTTYGTCVLTHSQVAREQRGRKQWGFILCPWDHSSYGQREVSSHSEPQCSPIVRGRCATAGCPGAALGRKCNKEYKGGLPPTHSECENSLSLLLGLKNKGSS